MLEQPEEESIRRLTNRRIDPTTGIYYNLEILPPKDEATSSRLVELTEDKEATVRQRCNLWNENVPNLEEAFKNMLLNVQSDKPVEQITELICDAI
jgi:adenylate kinase family enzyme